MIGEMREHYMICYRGCLNGKKDVCIDLCIIECDSKNNRIYFMFRYDLIAYLHKKRGNGKLGHKNGYQTAGWLDVLNINNIPKAYKSKVIKVDSFDIGEVYKIIESPLRKVIAEKIKIKKKGE